MGVNGVKEGQEKGVEKATLDDAMLLTGLGLYNVVHTLMSGCILSGVIMQSLMLGYVMPAAQCDLNLSTTQRGWLSALPFIAIILTSHMWGYLADTRGRKPVMLYSMLISAIFSLIQSFSPNLAAFAVLQFLSSTFMSGTSAVVYTYLGEFNNLRHRDKMVAYGSSFVGFGTIFLPCIAWLILPLEFALPIPFLGIDYRPWRLLLAACAMPYLISCVFLYFASESPKFLNAVGQYEECLNVVKKIYSVNKRVPEDEFSVKSLITDSQTTVNDNKGFFGVLKSMKDQTVPLFKSPLLPWTLLTCFVQFSLLATTNGFYLWFPTILNSLANHEGPSVGICEILDANKNTAVNGTVLCDDSINTETFERSIYIGLFFTSMYIFVALVVDYVGKKIILIIVIGVAGVCGIGAHLANNQQVGIILFAIFQMSGACIGLTNAVSVELFPTKLRAMAICLSMMMGRVGSVIGSNIIGLLLEVNCGLGFYLFGGLLLACASACFTLPAKNKKKSKNPTAVENQEPA